jgi:hypothetical protein
MNVNKKFTVPKKVEQVNASFFSDITKIPNKIITYKGLGMSPAKLSHAYRFTGITAYTSFRFIGVTATCNATGTNVRFSEIQSRFFTKKCVHYTSFVTFILLNHIIC